MTNLSLAALFFMAEVICLAVIALNLTIQTILSIKMSRFYVNHVNKASKTDNLMYEIYTRKLQESGLRSIKGGKDE